MMAFLHWLASVCGTIALLLGIVRFWTAVYIEEIYYGFALIKLGFVLLIGTGTYILLTSP